MKPSIYGLALAPALVAGTCLILSASSSGAQDAAPADNRIIMSGPGRISGEQPGAATEVEGGTQVDSGAEAQVEPEVEPDPEAEVGAEADAEAAAPAGGKTTMSGPGRLSQARAAAEGESQAEAVAEAQTDEVADPLEKPVSYTNDQAARGEEEYEQECEECHGSDLRGGLIGGAPLRGVVFEEHWGGGLPASALYSYMSATMPPNAPGRLSPTDYADIQAYLLQRNGYPSGAPLPADLDALDYLIMEK